MDAVTFIRQSPLFTSEKYAELHPILNKLLSGTLRDEDLLDFVDEIAPVDTAKSQESSAAPKVVARGSKETGASSKSTTSSIKAIKEIQQARNIGLIADTPPLKLGQGLTVFYGHNASGKTSLYKAISNCLGLASHAIENVNIETSEPAHVQLLIEDTAGNVFELAWPSKEGHERANVKCFDSGVSLSLVRDPQQNTFSLAHLKQEYFALLGDAFEKLATQIDERKQRIVNTLTELTKMIQATHTLLSDMLLTLTVEQVNDASISGEERDHLSDLEVKLAKLEKEDLPAKVKTFANDIARIDEILSSVGSEKADATWELLYTAAHFQQMRDLISRLTQYETTLGERASHLSDSLKLSRLSWEFDRRPGNVRPRLCDSLLAVNCIT